jgi:hypothetical protein
MLAQEERMKKMLWIATLLSAGAAAARAQAPAANPRELGRQYTE